MKHPLKTHCLLLCSLAPAAYGWLVNATVMRTMLLYRLSVPVCAVFCLWLGRRCAGGGSGYLRTLLLTQWFNLFSIPLYLWQFHLTSGEARSMTLAMLAQMPAASLLPMTFGLVRPFAGNDWGQMELTAGIILSVLLMLLLFSAGYLWGKKKREERNL